MAGRIRDEDVKAVRDRSPVADVIGEYVQLRNAGGGNLKGLCPFHDEKSPSFNVSPTVGLWHCFGCAEGGDVIRFIERIEHLGFNDAVERLAQRAGIQLRYVEGGTAPSRPQGHRTRLVEANAAAAAFYGTQLDGPEAEKARQFLLDRGFDAEVARKYGCGFAPGGWDALTKHLLSSGFTPKELVDAGLSKQSSRGSLIDRFHRRLLWPIRDLSGDVVGFGARRLFDDDQVEAKYLNTPETSIYKKSQLLYGVDLAKREIGRQHRAVIVEGYTDVMACHLSGVTTAVATCGTAFGTEHVNIIRRLLADSDAFTGEVIFTFDGDAAGMKAAERAFADDQKFMSQTFVAIEPTGMDPCELRQARGETAVRDLVARRIPLVEFVLRSTVRRFDMNTAEGTSAALDQAVPLVARIKDFSLRDEYARRLAGLVGVDDPNRVVARVRGFGKRDANGQPAAPERRPPVEVPDVVQQVERELLKIALQTPTLAGPEFDAIAEGAYLVPLHRAVRAGIAAAGGASASVAGPAWVGAVADAVDPDARGAVHELAVEPMRAATDNPQRYAEIHLARLQEFVAAREVRAVKARLQRLNPLENPDEYSKLFGELIALEAHLRALREKGLGVAG